MKPAGTEKRERTCVGCGAKAQKAALLRIVRNADGSVCFDETGNAPGRGAYVCSEACFDKALAQGKLQRALRVKLNGEKSAQVGSDIKAAMAAVRS